MLIASMCNPCALQHVISENARLALEKDDEFGFFFALAKQEFCQLW